MAITGGITSAVGAAGFQTIKRATGVGGPDFWAGKDLQLKNKYEFVITKKPEISVPERANTAGVISAVANTAASVAGTAASILITNLYCQSIEVNFPVVGTEKAADNNYASSIQYPESITVTFLEDEQGTVMRYLQQWHSDIQLIQTESPALFSNLGKDTDTAYGRVFRDNQEKAKRNGMLLLQKASREFSLYPRIMILGMMLKNIEPFTISDSESGNLTLTTVFSVADVRVPILI